MNAIRQILILWEMYWDSIEEEITAVVATRENEPKAMEEDVEDEQYVDQEEPEDMEMETKEIEEETAP